MKRYRAFFPLLILLALGVIAIASGALDRFRPEHLAQEQATLKELIEAHPILASLSQIGAMTLSIATGLPGAVVFVLAGGMLFGIVMGTFLSTVGLSLGALILFLASRHAFASHQGVEPPPIVAKLRSGYLAHPFSYTLFLRLVPFFPFGGVTIALAWLRCPLWLFITATTLGGAAMTGIETALGAGLSATIAEEGAVRLDIIFEPRVLMPMLALAGIALLPVTISLWRKRKRHA